MVMWRALHHLMQIRVERRDITGNVPSMREIIALIQSVRENMGSIAKEIPMKC